MIPKDFLRGQQWMCRGCFSAYSHYLALKKRKKITDNIVCALEKYPQFCSKKSRLDSSTSSSTSSALSLFPGTPTTFQRSSSSQTKLSPDVRGMFVFIGTRSHKTKAGISFCRKCDYYLSYQVLDIRKMKFPQLCHLLPILPNVRYTKNEISSIMSSITYPTKC